MNSRNNGKCRGHANASFCGNRTLKTCTQPSGQLCKSCCNQSSDNGVVCKRHLTNHTRKRNRSTTMFAPLRFVTNGGGSSSSSSNTNDDSDDDNNDDSDDDNNMIEVLTAPTQIQPIIEYDTSFDEEEPTLDREVSVDPLSLLDDFELPASVNVTDNTLPPLDEISEDEISEDENTDGEEQPSIVTRSREGDNDSEPALVNVTADDELLGWDHIVEDHTEESLEHVSKVTLESDEREAKKKKLNKCLGNLIGEDKVFVENLNTELANTKEELEKLKDDITCTICLTNRKDLIFECGHMLCRQCEEHLVEKHCPFCRKIYKNKILLFSS